MVTGLFTFSAEWEADARGYTQPLAEMYLRISIHPRSSASDLLCSGLTKNLDYDQK
jgi:hypothetical protein